MDLEDFLISDKCVDILTAREMLNKIQVATFKNRKQSKQKNILSAIEKQAFPKIGQQEKPNLVSSFDLMQRLKRAQNGR